MPACQLRPARSAHLTDKILPLCVLLACLWDVSSARKVLVEAVSAGCSERTKQCGNSSAAVDRLRLFPSCVGLFVVTVNNTNGCVSTRCFDDSFEHQSDLAYLITSSLHRLSGTLIITLQLADGIGFWKHQSFLSRLQEAFTVIKTSLTPKTLTGTWAYIGFLSNRAISENGVFENYKFSVFDSSQRQMTTTVPDDIVLKVCGLDFSEGEENVPPTNGSSIPTTKSSGTSVSVALFIILPVLVLAVIGLVYAMHAGWIPKPSCHVQKQTQAPRQQPRYKRAITVDQICPQLDTVKNGKRLVDIVSDDPLLNHYENFTVYPAAGDADQYENSFRSPAATSEGLYEPMSPVALAADRSGTTYQI